LKVAIFYPHNFIASWYALGGYVSALKRMGHSVLDCQVPGNVVQNVKEVKATLPTADELKVCDVIIVAYAEYLRPWLEEVYGYEQWKRIKTPKILRFDESFDRKDLPHLMNFQQLKKWGSFYSFPAAQDAEKYGGQWLPYGADLEMFHPIPDSLLVDVKKYKVGFLGTVYQSRMQYAQGLIPHLNGLPFNHTQIIASDLSGVRGDVSTQLLAENYAQLKVFFCLPPMSNLVVMKAFEVMACGTFLMYPRLKGESAINLSLFEDGKHLVYYEVGNYKQNAEQIRYYLEHEGEREKIAFCGRQKVWSEHNIEKMFNSMFNYAKLQEPKS
jgi:hypothetical protein